MRINVTTVRTWTWSCCSSTFNNSSWEIEARTTWIVGLLLYRLSEKKTVWVRNVFGNADLNQNPQVRRGCRGKKSSCLLQAPCRNEKEEKWSCWWAWAAPILWGEGLFSGWLCFNWEPLEDFLIGLQDLFQHLWAAPFCQGRQQQVWAWLSYLKMLLHRDWPTHGLCHFCTMSLNR